MFNFLYFVLQFVLTFFPVRRMEAARRAFKRRSAEMLALVAEVQRTMTDPSSPEHQALCEKGLKASAAMAEADKEVHRLIAVVHNRRCLALKWTTAICKGVVSVQYWMKRIFWAPLDFIRR
jgi:hypothetical protein